MVLGNLLAPYVCTRKARGKAQSRDTGRWQCTPVQSKVDPGLCECAGSLGFSELPHLFMYTEIIRVRSEARLRDYLYRSWLYGSPYCQNLVLRVLIPFWSLRPNTV